MTTPNPPPTPTIYPDYCHALSPTISRWCPLRAIDMHALRSVGMYVDGKELFHHLNHPIKWARLTGIVVAIDEFPQRINLTLDDGSGACIECVCACPPVAAASASTTSISTSTAAVMAIPEHLKQFQVRITESTKAGSREDAKKRGKRADQPSAQNPLVPWEAVDVGRVLKIKGQVTTFRGMKQIDVIKIEVLGGTEGEVRCWDEMVAFRRDVLSVPWVVSPEEEEGCRRERERSLRRERKKAKGGSSKREVEEEGHGEGSGSRAKGKEVENEDRRRRHEAKKRKKEREEGLDPRDNVNYPSMAVRRRVAGKYDALGI